MPTILFVCARNDARSPMAEGFARARLRSAGIDVRSAAGQEPASLHPLAARVMAEVGIDISSHAPASLQEAGSPPPDLGIEIGDTPSPWPWGPDADWLVWGLPDPAAMEGDEEQSLRVFRAARDRIRALVDDLFDCGYYCALMACRARYQALTAPPPADPSATPAAPAAPMAPDAGYAGIIGRHPRIREVFDMIREVAEGYAPVLIMGASGTGKELVAAAIHKEGPRATQRFVPINCGALPESLLESELFGHVKGAFTGAIRDKKGRFELADGGTIFLDEIGDISPAMQVKLLRVIQEGAFEPVGGEVTIRVKVRIISATNRDLAEEVAAGRFRDDLYYRLCVVPIRLPALRERADDIPLLAEALLAQAAREAGRPDLRFTPAALDRLRAHTWPGNVRELQNWLQYALVKCHGTEILPEHFPETMTVGGAASKPGTRARRLTPEAVNAALRTARGSKIEAARLLGISRATLYRFLGTQPPAH